MRPRRPNSPKSRHSTGERLVARLTLICFSLGSSRFSLGLSYAFGSKRRDVGFAGLPPSIPIIGEPRPVDVSFSRWLFVVGYLFGR